MPLRHAFRVTLALVLAVAVGACNRRPPEQRRLVPTGDLLAATPNAVGVPYGRVIVLRHGEHLIAVSFTASSQLGDRISYRWYMAGNDGDFREPNSLEQGTGEAVEQPYTGRIALPGRLVLEWSRGSDGFGWLYWPERPTDYAVYSRPFVDLDELADGVRGGRWLEQEMFRE